jgi:hypothetical protein
MTDQFDELTKSMAQSVTRRGALKKFGVGLAAMVLASLLADQSHAADLYVDANAAAGGDGSAAAPYVRITDAVVCARHLRQTGAISSAERIIVHVAAGNYSGTFNSNPLDNNGNKEVLPIILNVPHLTLTGVTVLDHDGRGLPTGPANQPQTRLKSSNLTDGAHQALLVIGRTTDGCAGDGVTVTGLTFGEKTAEGLGLVVDRVSDFEVRDNAFIHTGIGTIVRLSSGAVEGNYYLGNSSVGPGIGGGSINHPAQVTLSRNRSTGATGGADIRGEPSLRTLDLGANTVQLEPLQLVYDRNDPTDAANLPDTLEVAVSDNDFSGNLIGLWYFAYSINQAFGYQTADASQPKTSVVRATIVGNTFSGNAEYGIMAGAGGALRSNPRVLTHSFTASFNQNSFQDNGRTGALFGFVASDVSLGDASVQVSKYLETSTYQLTDHDGELAGFDYDNPVSDPLSGVVLNNALVLNGTTIAPGIKITSDKK